MVRTVKSPIRIFLGLMAWSQTSLILTLFLVSPTRAYQDSDQASVAAIAVIDSLLEARQWDAALTQAQALLVAGDLAPHAWLLQERVGLAWQGKGEFTTAISHFERAIALAPGKSSPHQNLAATLMAVGHRGRAFAEYQQAVALDPGNWRARLDYGQALLEFRLLADAREQLLAVREACGECPESDRALARFHLQAEEYASAVSYLERLYLADRDSVLRVNLATAYWQCRADTQLVALLQPYWPDDLSRAEINMILEADRKLGSAARAQEAVRSWQEGTSISADPVFWGIVSLTCLETGRFDEALVAADRAIQLDPLNVTYRNNRVVILTRLGRQAEAEAEWAQVLELAPHLEDSRQGPSP